jgi:hypothetical protein
MKEVYSRMLAIFLGLVIPPCTGAAFTAESCNQVELAPGSEGTVSVLLPESSSLWSRCLGQRRDQGWR